MKNIKKIELSSFIFFKKYSIMVVEIEMETDMKVVVNTQCYENYGSPEVPHWKPKFGSDYVVAHLSYNQIVEMGSKQLENMVAEICKKKVNYQNPMSEEYAIDWFLLEDNEPTEDEKMQMEYEGRILYPAKDISEAA